LKSETLNFVIMRPATSVDIPHMLDLERSSSTAAHWTELQYAQLFQPSGSVPERFVLVAVTPDLISDRKPNLNPHSLVGFLVARRVASEWELENIVIAAHARRKGLGKRLLEALFIQARQANSDAVFLEVRESNAAARTLYESAGFRQTGRRKSYYANPLEDAILYGLRLA
jgi:ribosomal-protein-alanine N-acetyltransferase